MNTTIKLFNQMSLCTVVVLYLTFTSALGQTEYLYEQNRNYDTWVKTISDNTEIKGYLKDVSKSHVIISNPKIQGNYKINFKDIEKIQFRKEENILLGMLIGGVVGGVIGGIIDHSSNQSSNSSSKSSNSSSQSSNSSSIDPLGTGWSSWGSAGFDLGPIATIFGASAGALIGGIVGSIKISKPINGNSQYQKEKLLKYKLTY